MCFHSLKKDISELMVNPDDFWSVCNQVYAHQKKNNPLFSRFVKLLGLQNQEASSLDEIPLIPISFFKNHSIKTGDWNEEAVFRSSGTTGQKPSCHYVKDLDWYHSICDRGFNYHFSSTSEYCHLGLLPSYLDRNDASLVAMIRHFINLSKYPQSGFYLNEYGRLKEILTKNAKDDIPTVLWGVTFGLLDFLETVGQLKLKDLIIIETGGMKGRRKEMIRRDLHETLKIGFGVEQVYSEYGMTELLSQAYTDGGFFFNPTPTIRYVLKDLNDPLSEVEAGQTGQIGCIDLGNIDTCSFILTDDIGQMEYGQLNVLGRKDNSEIRGCNLMVETLGSSKSGKPLI